MNEHLDIEQPGVLEKYLRRGNHIGIRERVKVERLSGGISNRTMIVHREKGPSWVLKQALSKLRVETDWFSPPSRIEREALGLDWLAKLTPEGTITPLIFLDRENYILAMEAVAHPHDNWKSILFEGRIKDDHFKQFGYLLGTLHRQGHKRREELAVEFADWTFFESLRLEPFYLFTADQVPKARAFLRQLVKDTRSRHCSLVHGDYSPKNILVHHEKLFLIDHEVIHFGEPAFDVGFSLAHLLSKAHHLKNLTQTFRDAALVYWREYRKTLGEVPWDEDLEARCVWHTLGCLLARVAGRSQLEYLSQDEKRRQEDVCSKLIRLRLESVSDLIGQFCAVIN